MRFPLGLRVHHIPLGVTALPTALVLVERREGKRWEGGKERSRGGKGRGGGRKNLAHPKIWARRPRSFIVIVVRKFIN